MKKLLALLLCVLTLLSLTACKGEKDPESAPASPASGREPGESGTAPAADEMPTVLNQMEYAVYQNVFFNKQADDYLGKARTVEGTLARVRDAFSDKTRYYVWGYMDATKCCDWQWEFVPEDPESLPPSGSLVRLSGTMTRDEAALDKIWFTDPELELKTRYEPADCDVDMTTMSATLERVQLLNMQYKPDYFQGKSLQLYGRVFQLDSIQHPYYDNTWTQKLSGGTEALPPIGTMVVVSGVWKDGLIQASGTEPTDSY